MNKRYIDFVPKSTTNPTATPAAGHSSERRAAEVAPRPRPTVDVMPPRPSAAASDIKAVKAKRLTGKKQAKKASPEPIPESLPEPAEPVKPAKSPKSTKSSKLTMLNLPVSHFINTEKVIKRPLSKNVYPKKVVSPKEEPQDPITIIARPEKDSRMGLVVTIIITIILGAAAGTIAFLLLPK